VANTPNKNSGGPRRLGPQQANAGKSSGAQRRQARAQKTNSKRWGWIIVTVVVVALAAVIIPKFTASDTPTSTTGATITASGDNPPLAPAGMVNPVTSVGLSVFNSVGINGEASPFVVTKSQPALTLSGKQRFVYVGAEYCPYCAAMRWSLVAALSRFGTFSGLKETASAPTDGNIPTFSFVGATYKSKYFEFTPYEECNRLEPCQALQTVPTNVQKLYTTYDAGSSGSGTIFSSGGAGIPFLDIANRYVSAGDPPYLSSFFGDDNGPLVNGGPGVDAIAAAIHDPSSAVGKGIGASGFIVMANYLSAGICAVDGSVPSSVCSTSGVKAAATALGKVTPIG
jgi:thiol-disulfide isomerase/thioredoxin